MKFKALATVLLSSVFVEIAFYFNAQPGHAALEAVSHNQTEWPQICFATVDRVIRGLDAESK